tara:strand:+ start:702 stop:1211 length:510 start_codon:yes stop_codon:yes gene_type:complete
MTFFRSSILFLFFYSAVAFSHGPTRQKVKETIEIKSTSVEVWRMIKNLDSAEVWHAEYSSLSSDNGMKKFISKRDGSNGLIEILSSNNDRMKFKYRLKNPASIPVNNYSAQVSVTSNGDDSKVTFKGAFYRKYVNNDPPPGEDDDAAIRAITEIYKNSLKQLKITIEEK